MLTFSIHAHNGGRGPAPELTKWAGPQIVRADLPTSHGLDTRDRAWKVQTRSSNSGRHVDIELVDHRRVMPLITFAHGEAEIDRLVRALRDLVDAHPNENGSDVPSFPSRRDSQRVGHAAPRRLLREDRDREVPPGRRTGERRAGHAYPPGIPAVAPGELYTEQNIGYLEAFVEAGGFVEGASDPTLQKLRVVAE